MKVKSLWPLLVVSFIEGGALMAVELIGAKLVSVHYGNSIYVWASVLGFTLGGLVIGYFLGGILSERKPTPRFLFGLLILSGVLVGILPWTSEWILQGTANLEFRLAILLSVCLILMPPIILFGTVSPMIIRLITSSLEEVGRSAGRIYAISTSGGILLNFLCGLWLIPFGGLRLSCWIVAILLIVFPVFFLLTTKHSPIPQTNEN